MISTCLCCFGSEIEFRITVGEHYNSTNQLMFMEAYFSSSSSFLGNQYISWVAYYLFPKGFAYSDYSRFDLCNDATTLRLKFIEYCQTVFGCKLHSFSDIVRIPDLPSAYLPAYTIKGLYNA